MKSKKEIFDVLRKTPTASLSDALDRLNIRGYMNYEIKPIIQGKRIAGPVVTILTTPSTKVETPMRTLETIDTAKAGDIIVITCEKNAQEVALFGGMMATASKVKGIEGVVLDGGVRDVVEMRDMEFQAFARNSIPTNMVGRGVVLNTNVPVQCGDLRVKSW